MTASTSREARWPIPAVASEALIVGYLVALVFSDYLSSWLPHVAGFPAGAIVRDALAVAVVVLGAFAVAVAPPRLDELRTPVRVLLGIALIAALIAAVALILQVVFSSVRVPAVLAVRNLLLYFLAAAAVWILVTRGHARFRVVLTTSMSLAGLVAIMGILDTLTHGAFVAALGYSRDYAGRPDSGIIAGPEAAIQGIVRASGGISNALVFGYLMATAALVGAWLAAQFRRSGDRAWVWITVVAILASMACVSSLTRGAVISLAVGLLVLVIVERRRQMAALAGAVALAAVVASVAVPLLAVRDSDATGSGGSGGGGGGGAPTIVVRLGEMDEVSAASSRRRVEQFQAGMEALRQHPLGLGLAAVGSASLHTDGEPAIVTDFFWLMIPIQVGVVVTAILAIAALAALGALAVASPRALAPLLAVGVVFAVGGFLSAAPDAPVFAGFASVLAVIATALPNVQPIATETAATTVLRRSSAGA